MKNINTISCGLVFLFFATAMTIKSMSNVILFLLFITTLIYVFFARSKEQKNNNLNTINIKILKKFFISLYIIFSLPFIFTLLQYCLGYSIKIKYFDAPLRFLLSISCIFLLPFLNSKIIEKGLVGIIFGAFGLGIWGYISTTFEPLMWLDNTRAWNGFSNPIPYGLICVMFAVMSLIFPFEVFTKFTNKFTDNKVSKNTFYIIKILAFIAGLYGAYKSGSRISLLVFPVFILIAIYIQNNITIKQKIMIFIAFIICLSSSLFFVNNRFSQRIQDGLNDIEKYESVQEVDIKNNKKNDSYNTSMGLRFVMWSEAVKIIATDNNWLFGIGKSNFYPTMKKFYSESKIVKEIRATPHPHNEYLNSFVESGIFGLVSLFLIYLFPLIFYISNGYFKHKDYTIKFLAASGVIVCSGYIIAGVFDCYFWIVSLVNFYTLTNVIFISLILAKTTELKKLTFSTFPREIK